jgi:predicted Zn-dependent protease
VIEWPGFLYDGQTAERQPITLTLESRGVRVQRADGASVVWPITDLRQTQGSFSSEMLRLEIGTDPVQAVVVSAPGFVDAMRRAFPGANATLRGQSQTTRFALWSLGALAAAVGLYLYGAPLAATWAAARVPTSWEVVVGRNVTKDMAPESRQCTDPAANQAAQSMLRRLLAAAPGSPYEFTLVIIRDSMVNAFAAPGGFIVVHSGLLKAAETPEQFAGVLAHEVQHVLRRHTTRGILREAPLRLAIAAMFGGTSAEGVAAMVGSLGSLSYRRGDEEEADREGLRLLQAAGIDPKGMVEFMGVMERHQGAASAIPKYLSSHPNTADRAATLGALAAANTRVITPLDQAEWQSVRARCDR